MLYLVISMLKLKNEHKEYVIFSNKYAKIKECSCYIQ